MPIPIAVVVTGGGSAVCPPGSGVAPRVLTDFELVWVIEGGAVWTNEAGAVELSEGTVVLGRPGEMDSYRWDPTVRTRVNYVHFSLGDTGLGLPPVAMWPRQRRMSDRNVMRPLFQHIVWLVTGQPALGMAQASAAVIPLVAAFVTGDVGLALERVPFSAPVDRVLSHLAAEWATDGRFRSLPVSELSCVSGVSDRHLSRLFNEALGCGVAEAMRVARLEVVVSLLQLTDLPVARIAETVGFANGFHLSRRFKAAYGVPPSVFRTTTSPLPQDEPYRSVRRFVALIIPEVLR